MVIWPDADEPGHAYAQDVASLALEAGAANVAIVNLPGGLPKGRDLADPPPKEWDQNMIKKLIAEAQPVSQPTEAGQDESEGQNKRGPSISTQLVGLAGGLGVQFFHD